MKNNAYKKIEADTYFCFQKLLDEILDNYTTNTPGINKAIEVIKELIENVDKELFDHMSD